MFTGPEGRTEPGALRGASGSGRFRLLQPRQEKATALSLVTCAAAVTSCKLLPEWSIKHIENETECLSRTQCSLLVVASDLRCGKETVRLRKNFLDSRGSASTGLKVCSLFKWVQLHAHSCVLVMCLSERGKDWKIQLFAISIAVDTRRAVL